MNNDTIVNIATPRGHGAVGIIRISGEKALNILYKLTQKDLKIEPRVAKHTFLKDKDGKNLGDAIVIYFKAPNSYTGEDVVEIQTFSSPVLLDIILSLSVEYGARVSKPGEFTERAFLNGKIDLLKAEAINKIVFSRDIYELKSSLNTLEGKLTEEIKKIIDDLNNLMLTIEASISFPNDVEGLKEDEILSIIEKNIRSIDNLLKNYENSRHFIEGIKLIIFGKANVGKSSLFNILMEEERVIVSDIPGTTRDIVKERIYIDYIPVDLIDTAGVIRDVKNELDKIAQERSEKILDKSDLIILIFDRSVPLNEDDFYAIEKVKEKNFIPVLNKIDIEEVVKKDELEKILNKEVISISCLKRVGIEKLKNKILEIFREKPNLQEIFYITSREKNLLIEAKNILNNISKEREEIDKISFSLRDAIKTLKYLIGEEFNEEILREIFDKFCIGK
jgi:tRNA modification GTPase